MQCLGQATQSKGRRIIRMERIQRICSVYASASAQEPAPRPTSQDLLIADPRGNYPRSSADTPRRSAMSVSAAGHSVEG